MQQPATSNVQTLFLLLAVLLGGLPLPLASAEPASAAQYDMKVETAVIPMPDGVKLSADLFMPDGAQAGERFPVLLEYLPYRKDEDRSRNSRMNGYFVERGYVVARVDIRGTGNSEGKLVPYEYSDQNGPMAMPYWTGWPHSPGLLAKSPCSAFPGAALTPSRWPVGATRH